MNGSIFSRKIKSFLFDTTNVYGFYCEWLIQTCSGNLFCLIATTFLSLFIGLCQYICGLFDLLEFNIEKLNCYLVFDSMCPTKSNQKLKIEIINLIHFHLDIFELIETVQDLMSVPFFSQLFTFALFMGHALASQVFFRFFFFLFIVKCIFKQWNVHFQIRSEDIFDIIVSLYTIFLQTVLNFIICYFSDKVSTASLHIANQLYNIDWFQFPIKERLMILMMIKRTQMIFYFRGNGSYECSIKKFMRVFWNFYEILNDLLILIFFQIMGRSMSYYIVFRAIKTSRATLKWF